MGPRTFASPGSPARPVARARPLPTPAPSQAQRVPAYRTPNTRRSWVILSRVGNLDLSAFKERPQAVVRRSLSTAYALPAHSCCCFSPPPRRSPSVLYDTVPRVFADADLSGELPCPPVTACWPQEGVAFATPNILSGEVLRCNRHPLLQLALMGPGPSIITRQLGEGLDLLAAF